MYLLFHTVNCGNSVLCLSFFIFYNSKYLFRFLHIKLVWWFIDINNTSLKVRTVKERFAATMIGCRYRQLQTPILLLLLIIILQRIHFLYRGFGSCDLKLISIFNKP